MDHDQRGELATRDIVSQAIASELQLSGEDCVFIDCTHLKAEDLINHFPTIYHYCLIHGINITKDWIPVVPAQHYLCGGIVVDRDGKTTVEHLFAVGECSRTGLHGANRLASNSLLEALAFSHRIFKYLSVQAFTSPRTDVGESHPRENPEEIEINIDEIKNRLHVLMNQHVGIIRNDASLATALKEVHALHETVQSFINGSNVANWDLYECYNMTTVSILIIAASLTRNTNRGGFIKLPSRN